MQKKLKMPVVVLALLMMLSISVSALEIMPRWSVTSTCNPALSISGTRATCVADVRADSGATISGTMTLYRLSGGREYYQTSWSISGTTRALVSKTYTVTKGETYRLDVDVTVEGSNGSDDISVSTTKTCN